MQRQHAMARRALLACGILSTALYASLDVISGLRYDGYSFASRAVSELSAVGAPTRSLWTAWGPVYQILVILFGCGVWASAGGKRALRIVSGLLDRSPYSRMTSDFPARNSELEQTTATVCEWRRTSAQVNIS